MKTEGDGKEKKKENKFKQEVNPSDHQSNIREGPIESAISETYE